jgi:ATP-dependent helicase/nuclease subunit B
LRAEERKLFELDVREQGSFQHDVLALFHQELQSEGKRWREVTPQEARGRVAGVAKKLVASYREGLLEASEQTRFMARVLTESLQDLVEIIVGWMREQYQFDPVAVELGFGTDETSPAWAIDLQRDQKLELWGRIDRVDLRKTAADEALCVVIDYKSSQKQLDPVLITNGLQLQLLTYLNVLRHWPSPDTLFGVRRLSPAGVFYVNLRGRYDRQPNRNEALADPATARKFAYQHTGRFDVRVLRQLDSRPDVRQGDQFNFRTTHSGRIHRGSREALPTAEFQALLDEVEQNLKDMGTRIFSGVTAVAPYRKGTETACGQCSFQSICRVDPWSQPFRVLKAKVARSVESSSDRV